MPRHKFAALAAMGMIMLLIYERRERSRQRWIALETDAGTHWNAAALEALADPEWYDRRKIGRYATYSHQSAMAVIALEAHAAPAL